MTEAMLGVKPISAEWLLLSAFLPGRKAEAIGIVLFSHEENELHIKVKDIQVSEDDQIVWMGMEQELYNIATTAGAEELISWLEEASHSLVASERHRIQVSRSFPDTLLDLFDREVKRHSVA